MTEIDEWAIFGTEVVDRDFLRLARELVASLEARQDSFENRHVVYTGYLPDHTHWKITVERLSERE